MNVITILLVGYVIGSVGPATILGTTFFVGGMTFALVQKGVSFFLERTDNKETEPIELVDFNGNINPELMKEFVILESIPESSGPGEKESVKSIQFISSDSNTIVPEDKTVSGLTEID